MAGGGEASAARAYAAGLEADIGAVTGSAPAGKADEASANDNIKAEIAIPGPTQTRYVHAEARRNGPDGLYYVQFRTFLSMESEIVGHINAKLKGNPHQALESLGKDWFGRVREAGEDQKALARIPRNYVVDGKGIKPDPDGKNWQKDVPMHDGTFMPGRGDYLSEQE